MSGFLRIEVGYCKICVHVSYEWDAFSFEFEGVAPENARPRQQKGYFWYRPWWKPDVAIEKEYELGQWPSRRRTATALRRPGLGQHGPLNEFRSNMTKLIFRLDSNLPFYRLPFSALRWIFSIFNRSVYRSVQFHRYIYPRINNNRREHQPSRRFYRLLAVYKFRL